MYVYVKVHGEHGDVMLKLRITEKCLTISDLINGGHAV